MKIRYSSAIAFACAILLVGGVLGVASAGAETKPAAKESAKPDPKKAAKPAPKKDAKPAPKSKYTKYCDGPAVNWRLSLWGKRRAFTEGMEYVAKSVREYTCDKFKILLYYGEQLSKSKENLDAISVGAIEAATICAAYHPGKNRPLNVLDLPFLPLENFDVMRRVHDAVYRHPAAKQALEKWNARIYMSNILP